MRLATLRAYLHTRIVVAFARAKQLGLMRTALRATSYVASPALGLLLSPVALALHVIGFRRLTFGTARIGHLASEPDSFLKLARRTADTALVLRCYATQDCERAPANILDGQNSRGEESDRG
jgi:hypothetical protein